MYPIKNNTKHPTILFPIILGNKSLIIPIINNIIKLNLLNRIVFNEFSILIPFSVLNTLKTITPPIIDIINRYIINHKCAGLKAPSYPEKSITVVKKYFKCSK